MRKLFVGAFLAVFGVGAWAQQQNRPAPCDPGNAGLTLPQGFCAAVVADNLGPTRHITFSPRGDLYTVLQGRGRFGAASPEDQKTGAVLALRDADGDGRFEQQERFGPGLNGTEVEWHNNYLYVGSNTQVVRFRMSSTALAPQGQHEVIVDALPLSPGHSAKPFAFGPSNQLYLHVGAPSNACQPQDRRPEVPGEMPCAQLEQHAGVWMYNANKVGQKHGTAGRMVTGIRHTTALTWNPATRAVYGVAHGRDQLDTLWPKFFTKEQNRDLPAEELQVMREGANYGWPYCFYDPAQKKRVQNPEYGGDGKKEGDCAKYDKPLVAFPAHNAPTELVFYTGTQFPAEYRNGAFVAFHGSWNRSPFAMEGFNIRFVPFKGDTAAGDSRVFASGFAGTGEVMNPNQAQYRPAGMAIGRDGSLYVSDDTKGRIWRITYTGR
jgi:glucose/arabinose dehydrogenase